MSAAKGKAVEIESLRKTFRPGGRGRAVEALKGVSLSVEAGQIFGLLGPNGSGKSTLVKILLGIVRPTGGKALLLGRPAGDPEARRAVGFQPEDARLPDYHTAATLLRYYGGLSGMGGSDLALRIPETLAAVGLSEWAGEKVRKYSKGMRQRLSIAQALLADPEALFLDEPTDGLDPIGRVEVRDLLLGLKARGRTVFVNSHLLSEVETVCDRVAILKKGELVAEGRIEDLTRHGHEHEIAVEGWTDAAAKAFAAAGIWHELRDGKLRVRLPSASGIDGVVDLLRAQKVGVRGLRQARSSLEEVFVSLVGPK